jgi:hypothetical protein
MILTGVFINLCINRKPVITVSHNYSIKNIRRTIFTPDKSRSNLLACLVFFICLTGNTEAQVQFSLNSTYKYLKGSSASTLAGNWMTEAFDDSGWSSGSAPFRYSDGTGGTVLNDMLNSYPTVTGIRFLQTHHCRPETRMITDTGRAR